MQVTNGSPDLTVLISTKREIFAAIYKMPIRVGAVSQMYFNLV